MLILGYSGLNNALAFRKRSVHGLSEAEERMCQGFDSAAVLLNNGEIVAAAEEERFSLDKHTGDFPFNAINYCLKEAKASIEDVNFICHGFNFSEWKFLYKIDEFSKNYYDQIFSPLSQIKLFEEKYSLKNTEDRFVPVRHHTAHAASAFYPSNFEKLS